MIEIGDITLPVYRYIAGESDNVCRLCFSATDDGASLEESRHIQCHYFDDTVSLTDMLIELGITIEPALPPRLCAHCVDTTIKSFLFQKLCQYSNKKWDETLEQFNKTLDLPDTLRPTVKTVFLVLQNKDSLILTSRKQHTEKNKEAALKNLRNLIKARQAYQRIKKRSKLICEECGEKFPSGSYLAKHNMRLHSNVTYQCKFCPKVLASQAKLQDHVDRVHEPKNIQCPKCAQMFSTEKMLKYHDASNHVPATCKRCCISFPSRKDLRQHCIRHDVHKCLHCEREFLNKDSFRMHSKMCGQDPEQLKVFCDICNKGYAGKRGLRSHLITGHGFGRVYPCNWCNKPFDAVSKLKNHIVKHTRERNFYCDQCGGQFVTQAALVYHIRIHTGERPFPCDMCDESFLSASRRMVHKRRKHFGPHRECTICNSKFVTAHELRKHIARHKNPQSRLFVAENEGENNNIAQKRKIMYF